MISNTNPETNIQVCLLTSFDIGQINEIAYYFWQEDGIYPLSELLRLLRTNLSYGFKIKNELIALCLIDIQHDRLEVYLFAVKHTYHRMGLGKKLMQFCISNANHEGYKHFSLHVNTDNIPAQKLYLSVGFEITSLNKGYYSNENHGSSDAYVMELILPSSPKIDTTKVLGLEKTLAKINV